MCLILLAIDVDPRYRLILAANRDEFRRRNTAGLHRWSDRAILGGRDLEAGGTWLALGATGAYRMAAVTNVRDGRTPPPAAPRSRGELPVDFADGHRSAREAAVALVGEEGYPPVNLLVDDGHELWWATNHPAPVAAPVSPGIHGLSNAALDDPWPKVTAGTARLAELLAAGDATPASLLEMLHNTTRAPDERLPDTGIGIDQERALSPMFLTGAEYGTRASTILRVDHHGHGDLTERCYDTRGATATETLTF